MTPETSTARLPRTVWALGFTSLFMDISSELIHGLLLLFLVVTLGASPAVLGLVEGIAEGAAYITRVFSGWVSDVFQRRKALAVVGYGLAAITKPLFPLAQAVWVVAAARFVDRVGKGIRGAPRDALIADVTPAAQRGAAFGLRQSLDTVGATVGPLLAIGLMYALDDDIRAVLWFAVVPAVISVAILMIFVKEPASHAKEKRVPIKIAEVGALGRFYWFVVAAGAVFTLARFSEAFLVLRAHDQGLVLALAPAVIAVMSVVFAASAYPAGRLQDRFGARPLLIAGLVALIAADLLLGLGRTLTTTFLGIVLWGLHMGLTQGVLAALVAEAAPPRLRGTAFGLFGLVTGIALFAASILAGVLWELVGADATFCRRRVHGPRSPGVPGHPAQRKLGALTRGACSELRECYRDQDLERATMDADTLKFRKMNGLGNDFVVLDVRARAMTLGPDAVRAIADRKEGVGCDQIIALEASDKADVFMRIWNADGGEVGACGNAARCVAGLVAAEKGHTQIKIETVDQVLGATVAGDGQVTIDMGAPRLRWDEIPLAEEFHDTRRIELQAGPIDAPVLHSPAVVNVGNPHAVFFVDDVEAIDLGRIGPMLEHHPLFPERANISVVQVLSPEHLKVRTWERGAGLTRACGTAACASAVAAVRRALAGRRVTVSLPGGDLLIEWREADGHVLMTGPYALDFEGTLPAELLAPAGV